MEIKTDSKRLREIMFHLFVWFKISIYYFENVYCCCSRNGCVIYYISKESSKYGSAAYLQKSYEVEVIILLFYSRRKEILPVRLHE